MAVLIDNRQNSRKISRTKLNQKAKAILSALDSPEKELSILIVDDSQIAELNSQYLNRSGPTNVIAFPMNEGEFSDLSPYLLGDVVISVDAAAKEGKMAGITMEERFTELLVHGILHLFGFDHENNEDEAREMEKKSEEIMRMIK